MSRARSSGSPGSTRPMSSRAGHWAASGSGQGTSEKMAAGWSSGGGSSDCGRTAACLRPAARRWMGLWTCWASGWARSSSAARVRSSSRRLRASWIWCGPPLGGPGAVSAWGVGGVGAGVGAAGGPREAGGLADLGAPGQLLGDGGDMVGGRVRPDAEDAEGVVEVGVVVSVPLQGHCRGPLEGVARSVPGAMRVRSDRAARGSRGLSRWRRRVGGPHREALWPVRS